MPGARALAMASWLAGELHGRVMPREFRTGLWLRRTYKVVASSAGPAWECYVTAASIWLWINNLGLKDRVSLSVNRRSPGMGLTEPLPRAFERLALPVYVQPPSFTPPNQPTGDARAACRRHEPVFAALALRRGEYITITQNQVTLWNRRPSHDLLRSRIRLLAELFAAEHRG